MTVNQTCRLVEYDVQLDAIYSFCQTAMVDYDCPYLTKVILHDCILVF